MQEEDTTPLFLKNEYIVYLTAKV